MKVYETHTKVLARKISDVSMQQFKKKKKREKENEILPKTWHPQKVRYGPHVARE